MDIDFSEIKLSLSFEDNDVTAKINKIINSLKQLGEETNKLNFNNLNTKVDANKDFIKTTAEADNKKIKIETDATEVKETTENINKLTNALNKAIKAERNFKGFKNSFKNIAIASDSTFRKLTKMLGRLTVYRFFSTYYSKTLHALVDGIKRVAIESDRVNKALSETATIKKQLVSAIGSMYSEIYVIFAPILSLVGNGLVKITESFTKFFAILQGKDTYLKAKKHIVDYKKELQKLKSATLGIDNLNIVGSKEDNRKNFEEVKISDDAKDKLDDIKTRLLAIGGIALYIGSYLRLGFAPLGGFVLAIEGIYLLIDRLFNFIATDPRMRKMVGDLFNTLKNIFGSVSGVLSTLLDSIITLIDGLMPLLLPVMQVVNIIAKLISSIITSLSGVLVPIIETIGILLKPPLELLGAICTIITDIIDLVLGGNVDGFLDAFNFNMEFLQSIFENVKNIVGELITTTKALFSIILSALSPIFEIVKGIFKAVGGVFTFISGIYKSLASGLFEGVSQIFLWIWDKVKIVIDGVKFAFELLGNILKPIVDGVKFLFDIVTGPFKWIINGVKAMFGIGGDSGTEDVKPSNKNIVPEVNKGTDEVYNNTASKTDNNLDATLRKLNEKLDDNTFNPNLNFKVELDGDEIGSRLKDDYNNSRLFEGGLVRDY